MNCPACGEPAGRDSARFCSVCGKLLLEGYQPLDMMRSSYGLQRKALEAETRPLPMTDNLFEKNTNGVSDTAWACVVYSLVPYLGVFFIPLAFLTGGIGYLVAVRQPHLGGRRTAVLCIGLSMVILGIQLLLWWLLYIIPDIGL